MHGDFSSWMAKTYYLNFKVRCEMSTGLMILLLVLAVALWLFDELHIG